MLSTVFIEENFMEKTSETNADTYSERFYDNFMRIYFFTNNKSKELK